MNKISNRKGGFTLIETLLYVALFAIVIGGGMIAAYQIIQATDAGANQTILQEEANFLLRKINWALTGLGNSSSIANTDTALQVTKSDGTKITICFFSNTSNFYLQRGATPCTTSSTQLNSSNMKVLLTRQNTFIFKKVSGSPVGITTSFTLTTAQNGRNTKEDFSTTKYLRLTQ